MRRITLGFENTLYIQPGNFSWLWKTLSRNNMDIWHQSVEKFKAMWIVFILSAHLTYKYAHTAAQYSARDVKGQSKLSHNIQNNDKYYSTCPLSNIKSSCHSNEIWLEKSFSWKGFFFSFFLLCSVPLCLKHFMSRKLHSPVYRFTTYSCPNKNESISLVVLQHVQMWYELNRQPKSLPEKDRRIQRNKKQQKHFFLINCFNFIIAKLHTFSFAVWNESRKRNETE